MYREFIRARRSRAIFRLAPHERGFVYLALRLKVRFESFDLIRAAVAVLTRLKEMGDEFYAQLMKGMRLAWMYSGAAVAWGNSQAKDWRNDTGYIEFLGKFSAGVRPP